MAEVKRYSQFPMCEYTPVAQFYNGETILITGGTGFLGKVVLEKLLYSCPGINKIYILIREKQNSDGPQRLQGILNQQIFDRVKNERPLAPAKVIPIVGDISEPDLGLSVADEKNIRDNVSILFHVAANIRFNEPLEVAMNVNLMGTSRTLELFRRLENKKAFVYVSTAYTNLDRKYIEEIIYPAPFSIKEVKTLLDIGINEDQVKELTKCKLNTYIFTKAMAESLVAQNCDLPVTVVRPSIISASISEPTPGWIDTWMGASGVMTTIAKGFNRVLLSKPKNFLDLIPVDYVSNLMIVAAAKGIKTGEVAVYNASTSGENPISIKEFMDLNISDSVKNKFNDFPKPGVYYTTKKWIVILITVLLQVLPAYIADLLLFIMRKNTRYVKLQAKVTLARDTVEFFTLNNWRIRATKTCTLAHSLSPADRNEFPFNPSDINWKDYIPLYCYGIRNFLLNGKLK